MANIDFAALICSRLCHDLVSPVGALSNGVEILSEEHDDHMREQVLDLLQKSAKQTSNKLQFFRLAFGAGGAFAAQLDMGEAEKATANLLEDSKVKLDWRVHMSHAQKRVIKLLLNLALIASDGLIRGGTLLVEMRQPNDRYIVKVTAIGERFILADELKTALTSKVADEELTPRTAPSQLAYEIAATQDGAITVKKDADDNTVFATDLLAPAI